MICPYIIQIYRRERERERERDGERERERESKICNYFSSSLTVQFNEPMTTKMTHFHALLG